LQNADKALDHLEARARIQAQRYEHGRGRLARHHADAVVHLGELGGGENLGSSARRCCSGEAAIAAALAVPRAAERQLDLPSDDNYIAPSSMA
jgi:hypothetical protein